MIEIIPLIDHHKSGSVHVKGQHKDGQMIGFWQWFRPDGTLKRSGYFDKNAQFGEWITYDKSGVPYKTTYIKPKVSP